MSLTLQSLYQTLLSQTPSLTLFAPSDPSFTKSGQPSLDLLLFHLSPLPLPPENLRLLPAGSEIPTMLNNHSHIVTDSHSDFVISLNYVQIIDSSPVYEDGLFLIYGIDSFFDPNFQYTSQGPSPNPLCGLKSSSDSFGQAIETLRSTGYAMTASFLGLQMNGISDGAAMTVFAPEDEMVKNVLLRNFSEYPSFFLGHVVPCKVLWNDQADWNNVAKLPTILEGFFIDVTRSAGGVLVLN